MMESNGVKLGGGVQGRPKSLQVSPNLAWFKPLQDLLLSKFAEKTCPNSFPIGQFYVPYSHNHVLMWERKEWGLKMLGEAQLSFTVFISFSASLLTKDIAAAAASTVLEIISFFGCLHSFILSAA